MSNAVVTQDEVDAKYDELNLALEDGRIHRGVFIQRWCRQRAEWGYRGDMHYTEDWTMGGVWRLIDWLSGLVQCGIPLVLLWDPKYHQSPDPGLLAFERLDVTKGLDEVWRSRAIDGLRAASRHSDPAEACRVAIGVVASALDGSHHTGPAHEWDADDLDYTFDTRGVFSERDLNTTGELPPIDPDDQDDDNNHPTEEEEAASGGPTYGS